jgi:hypothetical protein
MTRGLAGAEPAAGAAERFAPPAAPQKKEGPRSHLGGSVRKPRGTERERARAQPLRLLADKEQTMTRSKGTRRIFLLITLLVSLAGVFAAAPPASGIIITCADICSCNSSCFQRCHDDNTYAWTTCGASGDGCRGGDGC